MIKYVNIFNKLLLILVRVTISQLSGENGLIKRAKEAVERYKNASEQEQIQLGELEQYVSDVSITNYKGFALVNAAYTWIGDNSGWGNLGRSFSVTNNSDIFSVSSELEGGKGSIKILSDIDCEIVTAGTANGTKPGRSWKFNNSSISSGDLIIKTKLKKDDVIDVIATASGGGGQANNMVIVIAK